MIRDKNRARQKDQTPLTGKTEDQLNRIEVFKKMCRMLEMKRKRFLEEDWRHYAKLIPQQQFIHLMMVRHSLPCNLARIMQMTGLTSPGASIFVDKMVKHGVFERVDDPGDRRNVIINFTPRALEMVGHLEDRLNRYIFNFFDICSEEELAALEEASRIVCRVLDNVDDQDPFDR